MRTIGLIALFITAVALLALGKYFAMPKPVAPVVKIIYVHDTTVVRDIVIPCRMKPYVFHDTVYLNLKQK